MQLTPIIGDLTLLWSNLKDATRIENLNFWSQEWNKHGICSDFSSRFDYFNTTVQLKKQLNPSDYIILYYLKNYLIIFLIYITYFSVLGLTPRSRYTVQDVANIVKQKQAPILRLLASYIKRIKHSKLRIFVYVIKGNALTSKLSKKILRCM